MDFKQQQDANKYLKFESKHNTHRKPQ